MKGERGIFEKITRQQIESESKKLRKIKDRNVRNYLENILRLIVDIEEEITNNSFYRELIEGKAL